MAHCGQGRKYDIARPNCRKVMQRRLIAGPMLSCDGSGITLATPSGFTPPAIGVIMGHAHATAKNHPRRNARLRRSRLPDLLLRLSLLALDAISGDRWPDDARLSDLEPRFTCQACGRRGADVRPIGSRLKHMPDTQSLIARVFRRLKLAH